VTTGLSVLSGVRVIDFTQALSGPYCTLMLADLGADVTKVESPFRGDDSRHWGPPNVGEDAAYFMAVNRNKRSVTLDLKDHADIATARALIADADVVVENWRPGTADRLGLGAADLRAEHPGLIVCSISGFGQNAGPRSGYDQIVQGTSGVMSLTGPIGEPTKWGVPVGDIAAGMFAAYAIAAALYQRRETGLGNTIDVAMQDCLLSMLTHHGARYLNGGIPTSHNNGHPTIAPYGLFRTADAHVNICVGNDSQYVRFCDALDCSQLAHDPKFATNPDRLAHRAELLTEIDRVLSVRTAQSVLDALDRVGVPAGRVAGVADALDSPETRARGMVLEFERPDCGTARVLNTPCTFDGVAPAVRLAPPRLGEHHADVDHIRSHYERRVPT
jgi:crotonobetainyl-CoA:carnitine CoA-transferase CaiB-like acyl-CoA transferase